MFEMWKARRVRFSCAVLCLLLSGITTLRAQSSVAELNESGWKMIGKGEASRAARLFADALALQPDDPVLLFGAGVSAHLQGRGPDAKSKLQRTLKVNPRFTPASLLLGEIVYREGDLDGAIKMYDTALTFAPGHPQLTARLQQWRQEADVHGTLIERRQDRFRVMFEGRTDASLGARTTEALTAAFWRIGKHLGAYPSDSIQVILYTQKQFRDITRAPEWSGGSYDGRIRIPVAGADRSSPLFERVLVHELTHAMVTSIAPRAVPTWLHEGLAQHFDGSDAQAARRRLQRLGQHIPLDQLEDSLADLTPAGAAVAYDESLVAVNASWNARMSVGRSC
jgi:tetratricopeptide (TPR) repeat protein